jgi:hypothetical protein
VSLTSPTLVRARVRSGTNWSAIVEAQFNTPQDFSKLIVSEIHYHPPGVGTVDGEEFEFLELQNVGTNWLDVGGLTFMGISFTFTNETLLRPGAFFVLVRNPAQFAAHFPAALTNGVYTGKLENGGETITLSSLSGGTILSVTYDDVPPWPIEADGSGFSLQRVNALTDANNADNWAAAVPTPGAAVPVELVDTDGDGMPDTWEQAYSLDPTHSGDAAEDADGDGFPNLAEYHAGTDPRNGADYMRLFRVEQMSAGGSPTIVLRFPAVANKTYSVLSRQWPDHGCWTQEATIPAQTVNREVAVTNSMPAGVATRFYRLITPMGIPTCTD